MLRSTFGLEPDGNVGDTVVEAGEASEKVDGESAGGTLHIYGDLVVARCGFHPDVLNLLQQIAHRQDFVLRAAHRTRPDAGDLLQVPSTL